MKIFKIIRKVIFSILYIVPKIIHVKINITILFAT